MYIYIQHLRYTYTCVEKYVDPETKGKEHATSHKIPSCAAVKPEESR